MIVWLVCIARDEPPGRTGSILYSFNTYRLPLYHQLSTSLSLTIMNWTRGRLQRHSSNNKTAALTKIQKQNFAKARVKSSKDKYHQLPFQNFPQFGHFSNEIIPQDQEANNVDVVAIHTSTQQVRNMVLLLNINSTNWRQVWACTYESTKLFPSKYTGPLAEGHPLRYY